MIVASALSAALAVALLVDRRGMQRTRDRLDRLRRNRPAVRDRASDERRRRRFAVGLATLAAGWLVSDWLGILGVCLAAVGGFVLEAWLSRLEPRATRRRREQLEADAPLAAEILAACLATGSAPDRAAEAVAVAVGGPVGEELRSVVAHLRLGGDPISSWRQLERVRSLAPVGRSIARAAESGAPVAAAVAVVADEHRRQRRWRAQLRAHRVSVRAAAPLGLCFLPAFILIGIVPVVVGIGRTLMV
jgi:Flp pilus assembly protein TadB